MPVNFEKYLDQLSENLDQYSTRFLRFVAMYFPNAEVRKKCWVKTNVEIGEGSYLNPNVTILDNYQSKEIMVIIGKNCSIASGVVFAPYSKHNNSKFLRKTGILCRYEKVEKIIVGEEVWIGANCTLLPGIKIGDYCIIGANSLVNKNIPDYSLAYGNPIRIVRDIRD